MSTFSYFGEEFTYSGEFPAFAYAEFCETLDDGEESASARAMGVALRLAVECVAEPDRARFRRVSRKNNAKVEDWLVVFRDWTAAETERPTGLPTDSSSGPDTDPQTSESPRVVLVTSPEEPGPVLISEDKSPIQSVQRVVRGDLALALSRSAG